MRLTDYYTTKYRKQKQKFVYFKKAKEASASHTKKDGHKNIMLQSETKHARMYNNS
jgi:hypothetical protein